MNSNSINALHQSDPVMEYLEAGKQLFFHNAPGSQERKEGLHLLIKAAEHRNPEAQYLIGRLLVDGVLVTHGKDPVSYGKAMLWDSAASGWQNSRILLDRICSEQYEQSLSGRPVLIGYNGPLVDFSRKRIKIDRTGLLTPVDARLTHADGRNLLTLDVNLCFIADPDEDWSLLGQAVREGILLWQGDYTVFGGQNLSVEINLTEEDRSFDNVFIMPITKHSEEVARKIASTIDTKTSRKNIEMLFDQERSAAMTGLKWSVRSRKIIYIQQSVFDSKSYREAVHIAKHEFGHVLGLSDLYEEKGLYSGVAYGEYDELDGYHISDRYYNLVMCDHHGIISNNDIEMVVLAFSKNQRQNYQSDNRRKITAALGRGN